MRRRYRAALLLIVPLVVYLGVGGLMQQVSGRTITLSSTCAPDPAACTPLFLRLGGYDVQDATRYWSAVCTTSGLNSERRFQRLDLGFPLVYGAALGGALLLAWRDAARPIPLAILLAPLAGAMLADWAENVFLLTALDGYQCGAMQLDPGVIRLASLATQAKLVLAGMAVAALIALACRPRPAGP